MSILATFKTYWAANSTLQTAMAASKVFLDIVPEGTTFPYGRLSVLGSVPSYLSSGSHIESFSYQLSLFHTNFETLCTLADTVMGQLDNAYITAGTLVNMRQNRTMVCEVVNGVETYTINLDYDWSYNSSLA